LFAGESPEEPPVPAVLPPDADQLAKLTAAFEKAEAEKDGELLQACLNELSGDPTEAGVAGIALTHKSFEPFVKRALKSKDDEVESRAILAAATLEMKDEAPAIRKLLKAKPSKKKGSGVSLVIIGCAIDYLDRMGMDGDEKLIFEEHVEPLLLDQGRMSHSATPRIYRAGLRYLGRNKYKPCVKWLIDQIDRPEPANVNDGNNPPASYWKARTELWMVSEGWIRWALKEITGQSFRRSKEWKDWYDENKKAYEK
jgi:hypothetical protein